MNPSWPLRHRCVPGDPASVDVVALVGTRGMGTGGGCRPVVVHRGMGPGVRVSLVFSHFPGF